MHGRSPHRRQGDMLMSDNAKEELKGTAKELAGKVTGSDEMVKEGQAQQKKAEAQAEAENAEQEQKEHQGT